MIGRLVLAALLAGMIAGLGLGVIQQFRITPLILAAETYEATEAPAGHSHGDGAAAHSHDADEWKPTEGWERTLYTTVASVLTGAGFALVLAAVSLLSGIAITPQNFLVWGLAGFAAFHLAPAAGLPPELPGMPAGDLLQRQIWWTGTVAATGAAAFILATRRSLPAWALAAALITLPHLIGAPQPTVHETNVPAGLAASFATSTLAVNAAFWCMIAAALSLAMRFATPREVAG